MAKEWKPTTRQEEFVTIPDSVSEGFYGGAAGGGKSELLMMLPIIRGFHNYPRFRGLLMRRTYPELEKSLIDRSKEWYPLAGAKYQQQFRRWTFPSGASIDFGYAEHENDVRRYDTTEYNYIGWDELTSFTYFQYIYISKSRVRSSDTNLPSFVRSASNPGNIGHGWVRDRFVAPAPHGTIIKDRKTNQLRIFVQSLVTDNPHIANREAYIAGLMQLPEAEKRAKLYGDWWTFSGQVFEDFRLQPLSDEPANAFHVVKPFVIPPYWPRVLAIDWGFAAMNYCLKIAASPQGRAYAYAEQANRQTKISEWGEQLRDSCNGEEFVDRVLDPSAWAQTGAEKTVAEQVCNATNLSFRKADNDRLGGKTLIQEYLRWRPKPAKLVRNSSEFDQQYALYLMRNKGEEVYRTYVDSFVKEPEESNIPKLQIFDTLPELINVVPLCVYNEASKGNIEDVAEFIGDDPYDTLRYGVKAVDRFYRTSKQRFEQVESRDMILNRFAETHDYTELHRKMEVLESKSKRKRALRRFHGARVA